MLKITRGLNLRDFSGMRVGVGKCRNLYEVESLQDFQDLIEKLNKEEILKLQIIGEGSNTIFVNNREFDLLKININTTTRPKSEQFVKVGAGVNWDIFVQEYIKQGGVGMESLSGIPGTVGAAPIQNIGAYGHDVSEFIESVEVFDRKEFVYKTLQNKECEFTYRDSIFKKEKDRYIVLFVTFRLIPNPSPKELGASAQAQIPEYKDVQKYFIQNNIKNVTTSKIRQAVIEIRKTKLPDPSVIPNCGSFFKNPIINTVELGKVKVKFPEIPVFPVDGMKTEIAQAEELVKIPVAYIIERIGLKGHNADFTNGNFGIHKNHALIIISNGKGSASEFLEFVEFVKQKVFVESGLKIEEEVNLV